MSARGRPGGGSGAEPPGGRGCRVPTAGLRVRGGSAGIPRGVGAREAPPGLCGGSAGQGCSPAGLPPARASPWHSHGVRLFCGVQRIFGGVTQSWTEQISMRGGGLGVLGLWAPVALLLSRCWLESDRDTRWIPPCLKERAWKAPLAASDQISFYFLAHSVPSPAEKEGHGVSSLGAGGGHPPSPCRAGGRAPAEEPRQPQLLNDIYCCWESVTFQAHLCQHGINCISHSPNAASSVCSCVPVPRDALRHHPGDAAGT